MVVKVVNLESDSPQKLTNETVVRTVYTDQHEIIRSIDKLYLKQGVECDPTYSKGVFYRGAGISQPKYKFDLYPQTEDTVQASADNLPLENGVLSNLMFDPPFMAGFTKPKPTGLMGNRFHGFRYIPDLWKWYDACLVEFYRVLKPKGVLVFKCQDTVSSGKNWFTHVYVMNRAVDAGFYPRDMFVLTAKNRIIGHNHGNQKHARKFHSYFWVFEKAGAKVDYSITRDE